MKSGVSNDLHLLVAMEVGSTEGKAIVDEHRHDKDDLHLLVPQHRNQSCNCKLTWADSMQIFIYLLPWTSKAQMEKLQGTVVGMMGIYTYPVAKHRRQSCSG